MRVVLIKRTIGRALLPLWDLSKLKLKNSRSLEISEAMVNEKLNDQTHLCTNGMCVHSLVSSTDIWVWMFKVVFLTKNHMYVDGSIFHVHCACVFVCMCALNCVCLCVCMCIRIFICPAMCVLVSMCLFYICVHSWYVCVDILTSVRMFVSRALVFTF